MDGFFDNLVTHLRVDTTLLPTVVIDKPLAPSTPAEKARQALALRLLKPRFEIGIQGGEPIVIEKWGAPGPTKWPLFAAALGVGGGVLLGLAIYGGVALRRRRGSVSGLASLHGRRRRHRR